MDAKLKACPFCGGEAVIHSQDGGVCACDNLYCPIYLIFIDLGSWQTRTPPATPSPEVDGVQDLITLTNHVQKTSRNEHVSSPEVDEEALREKIGKAFAPCWSPNWRKMIPPDQKTLTRHALECDMADDKVKAVMQAIRPYLAPQGAVRADMEKCGRDLYIMRGTKGMSPNVVPNDCMCAAKAVILSLKQQNPGVQFDED